MFLASCDQNLLPVAKVAKIYSEVPAHIRDELNAKLVANGFSDYQGLTDWLNARLADEGLEVSLSVMAVNRHGQDFKEKFDEDFSQARQVRQIAKMAVADNDDAEGSVRTASAQILETKLLILTNKIAAEIDDGKDMHKIAETISKIALAMTNLGRMGIANDKHRTEIRKQMAMEAAEKAASSAKDAGVSAETIARIRRDVLGMAE